MAFVTVPEESWRKEIKKEEKRKENVFSILTAERLSPGRTRKEKGCVETEVDSKKRRG
jgi:hypothetical protein